MAQKASLHVLLNELGVELPPWPKALDEHDKSQNSWININEELDFLFDMDSEKKWTNAIKRTGIDFTKFSSYSGNA